MSRTILQEPPKYGSGTLHARPGQLKGTALMQVIDRSLQPSQYWPGLHALFGMDYDRLAPIYTSFFDSKSSEKAFEEFMTERAGLGLAMQQPELDRFSSISRMKAIALR